MRKNERFNPFEQVRPPLFKAMHISFRMASVSLAFVATGVLLVLTGCDKSPATYPVKGKVMIKGSSKSLAEGTVLFQSVENPEVQASGGIDEDGSFELFSNQGKPGTLPGEHRILIQPPEVESGQSKLIADKYRRYETSGLTRTVVADENDFTIELEPWRR